MTESTEFEKALDALKYCSTEGTYNEARARVVALYEAKCKELRELQDDCDDLGYRMKEQD